MIILQRTIHLARDMLNLLKKAALVAAGTGFSVLGLVGILLPLIPGTPFLLIAGVCFYKAFSR
ncbi:MAG: YbaN family protein [Oscillatoria princeps RMCB-10]|nr:YbaN family protein [Oscillatoria princeps RMCB-10]